MLLTYAKFNELGGRAPEDKFLQLESVTEELFFTLTNMYYMKNDIDKDPDSDRVYYYRKAMVLQIDYMSDIDVTTTYGIADKSIRSVSIDGTTVSTSKTVADSASHGLYNLAKWYLAQTGLLYRGVSTC